MVKIVRSSLFPVSVFCGAQKEVDSRLGYQEWEHCARGRDLTPLRGEARMKPVDGCGPSLPPTSLTVQAPLVYPQGYVESSLRADIGCPADLPEILHSAAREADRRLPAAPQGADTPEACGWWEEPHYKLCCIANLPGELVLTKLRQRDPEKFPTVMAAICRGKEAMPEQ
jgi:hypothetical protein